MLAIRRKAVQSAQRAPAAASRGTRRYVHAKAGEELHHSSADHGHHGAGPKNESLGAGFFLALTAIPIAIGVYTVSRPSADGTVPSLTKFIDSYSYYKDRWAARNTLHTAMIEQAAFDRHLFQGSAGSKTIELRFPETFNMGSPFNVSAGQGPRDMDKLVAHYEKLNAVEQERRANAVVGKERSS